MYYSNFKTQVLLSARRKVLSGSFFHVNQDVELPDFICVEHRMRLGAGKGREIDVLGAAGTEQWVCQSKWVREKNRNRCAERSEGSGRYGDAGKGASAGAHVDFRA